MKQIQKLTNTNTAVDFDQVWTKLHHSLSICIDQRNIDQLRYEQVYRPAYQLVVDRKGDQLTERLRLFLADHLKGIRLDHSHLLLSVISVFEQYTAGLRLCSDVLLYYDRVYVRSTPGVVPVYTNGMEMFYQEVLSQVLDKIQAELFELFRQLRTGDSGNAQMVKDSVSMFKLLQEAINNKDCYVQDFELPFIAFSLAQYKDQVTAVFDRYTVCEYLQFADKLLLREETMLKEFTANTTVSQLLRVLEDHVVGLHVDKLITSPSSGLSYMIVQQRYEELGLMYRLFGKVENGRTKIAEFIKAQLLQTSLKEWYMEIMTLRDNHNMMLERCFEQDSQFHIVITQALENLINQEPKATEFIAAHINSILDKKSKVVDLTGSLKQSVAIFRFIYSKDIFERVVRQQMSRRLISGRSVSQDAEREFVVLLRNECGTQYTAKMEGMLRDMDTSADLISQYKPQNTGIGMSVSVLTCSYWPVLSADDPAYQPPLVLSQAGRQFTEYYLKQHTGRKLQWLYNQGTVDLKFNYDTIKHEIVSTTYQATILLQFNSKDTISLAQLQCGIPEKEFNRHIQSMISGKYKLLVKDGTGNVSLNHSFHHSSYKFRVPLITLKHGNSEVSVDDTAEIDKAYDERKHIIDAAIVRIMKERGQLLHNQLIAAVIEHLNPRFLPDVQVVKSRIEHLIDREYLKRGSQDLKMYEYVA